MPRPPWRESTDSAGSTTGVASWQVEGVDTWVHQMIRVRSRRRVAAWALVLGSAIMFGLGQYRYVSNFLMGPFVFAQTDLDSISDVSTADRYFVGVTGSKVIDTGIQEITTRTRAGVETSRSVSAAYSALVVGERLLVVKGSQGTPATAEGELIAMPADLQRHLFNTPQMEAIRGRFYPYYLDDANFRLPGYIAIAAALVLVVLLAKYGLPAWRYLQDASSHPLVKRVASWGDPVGIALEAKREAGSARYKGGGWLVTDRYLIRSTAFTFDILRLSDCCGPTSESPGTVSTSFRRARRTVASLPVTAVPPKLRGARRRWTQSWPLLLSACPGRSLAFRTNSASSSSRRRRTSVLRSSNENVSGHA